MKVIYETQTLPCIHYHRASVYLDTKNETLSIAFIGSSLPLNVRYGIDLMWNVPINLLGETYNEILDEIKPIAEKLLKHHTLVDENNRVVGELDEVGVKLSIDIYRVIDDYSNDEKYRVMTFYPDPNEIEGVFDPYYISPSKLAKLVEGEIYNVNGYIIAYFDGTPKEFEEASMELVAQAFRIMKHYDCESFLDYLRVIKQRYKKDGYAEDFVDKLVDYLEDENIFEYVDGEWYFTDYYDFEEPIDFDNL